MTREIMIFDKSQKAGEELAREIRAAYKWLAHAKVSIHDPEEVFAKPLPEKPRAAFFTVSNMYEAEAMRKLHAILGGVPLIMVCDGGEFSLWSWELGTRYYLKRPVERKELLTALNRCDLDKPVAAFY